MVTPLAMKLLSLIKQIVSLKEGSYLHADPQRGGVLSRLAWHRGRTRRHDNRRIRMALGDRAVHGAEGPRSAQQPA